MLALLPARAEVMPVAAVGTLVLALVIACSNDELIMNCNHEYNYVTLYGVVGGWVRGLCKKKRPGVKISVTGAQLYQVQIFRASIFLLQYIHQKFGPGDGTRHKCSHIRKSVALSISIVTKSILHFYLHIHR